MPFSGFVCPGTSCLDRVPSESKGRVSNPPFKEQSVASRAAMPPFCDAGLDDTLSDGTVSTGISNFFFETPFASLGASRRLVSRKFFHDIKIAPPWSTGNLIFFCTWRHRAFLRPLRRTQKRAIPLILLALALGAAALPQHQLLSVDCYLNKSQWPPARAGHAPGAIVL